MADTMVVFIFVGIGWLLAFPRLYRVSQARPYQTVLFLVGFDDSLRVALNKWVRTQTTGGSSLQRNQWTQK